MPRLTKDEEFKKWLEPFKVFSFKLVFTDYDLNLSLLAQSEKECTDYIYKEYPNHTHKKLVHISNRVEKL